MNRTANIGLDLAVHRFRSSAPARVPDPIIGWTTPTVTYERMRALQANAERLNASIQTYVVEGPYKAGWRAWYANWTAFYEKYAGPDASNGAKLGALFNTDDLAAQVDRYEAEYQSYFKDYANQKTPSGGKPPPISPPQKPVIQITSGLPWWFWAGAGVAAVGIGYVIYNRYQATKKRVAYLDKNAPAIIDAFVPGGKGKEIAEIGQGRARP